MQNQRIKNFWIKIISDLKMYKGVAPNLITENEGNTDDILWQEKLNSQKTWNDVRDYALIICEDIFTKATVNTDAWVGDSDSLFNYIRDEGIDANIWDGWGPVIFGTIRDNDALINDTQTHLGVDDLSDLTTKAEYTMPTDLGGLIFMCSEFNKTVIKNLNIFDRDVAGNISGVNNNKIDALIEAKDTIDNITPHLGGTDLNALASDLNDEGETLADFLLEIAQLEQAIEAVLGDPLPTDFANQLTQLKTNSDHYTRIHTKLSGKVSDTELDTLLSNTPPPMLSFRLRHH